MNFEIIMDLMDKMSETGMTKFSYKKGDTEIKIENNKTITVQAEAIPASVTAAVEPVSTSSVKKESAAPVADPSVKTMTCPLIGTFYTSPAPDMPPFAQVGDQVKKGQVIGIVEAMKLMNEIECEFDGVIKEILVSNEQTVEFGQPLFLIKE